MVHRLGCPRERSGFWIVDIAGDRSIPDLLYGLVNHKDGREEPFAWNDRLATNEERLDAANGILLSANIDILFDKGFVSFDERGRMLVSPLCVPRI